MKNYLLSKIGLLSIFFIFIGILFYLRTQYQQNEYEKSNVAKLRSGFQKYEIKDSNILKHILGSGEKLTLKKVELGKVEQVELTSMSLKLKETLDLSKKALMTESESEKFNHALGSDVVFMSALAELGNTQDLNSKEIKYRMSLVDFLGIALKFRSSKISNLLKAGLEDFYSNTNLVDLEDAQLRIILVDQLELFQLIKIEAPEFALHIYQNAQPIFKKNWELKSN